VAHSLSAKKRMRQNQKRHARNRVRKSRLKTQVRKLTDAIGSGDADAARTEYRRTAKLLDQTAAKGTIHRKTADRRKSRLAKRVAAMG